MINPYFKNFSSVIIQLKTHPGSILVGLEDLGQTTVGDRLFPRHDPVMRVAQQILVDKG